MQKCMGIETEYGIFVDGMTGASDCSDSKVSEAVNSMLKVARTGSFIEPIPGYRPSDKNRDFLLNGSRFYNDGSKPEYSTPECLLPDALVASDKAGEIIVRKSADAVAQSRNQLIEIYKKNSDGYGNTYGCHENYLISPDLFERITGPNTTLQQKVFASFLAIRQPLTGAGKIGSESWDLPCLFQVSQRADFMEVFLGSSTLGSRPIIQTRDESHADRSLYRRLHVIAGDANMCEWSTYLKVGLTTLILMMLEDGYFEEFSVPVFKPAVLPDIFKAISRDADFTKKYKTTPSTYRIDNSGYQPLLDLLKNYLDAIDDYVNNYFPDSSLGRNVYEDVIRKAKKVHDTLLKGHQARLFGVLDWATKRVLAEDFLRTRNLTWEDAPRVHLELRSYVDMSFTRLDDNSLYNALKSDGIIHRIVTDTAIASMVCYAPRGRSEERTLIARRLEPFISYMDWEVVACKEANTNYVFWLDNPAGNDPNLESLIRICQSPSELARAIELTRSNIRVKITQGA